MTMTCTDCGQPRGQGSGRGLCKRCYNSVRKRGTIATRPRTQRPLAETIAQFDALSAQGLTTAEIAARLGMKRASLCSALSRAGRGLGRGDCGSQPTTDDRIVDEVAIARCVAGSLNGRRLTRLEREHAVPTLSDRGHSPREIARRVGVSLAAIGSVIGSGQPERTPSPGLERATPPNCTPTQAELARRTVALSTTDAADARDLLLALGLISEHRDSTKVSAA